MPRRRPARSKPAVHSLKKNPAAAGFFVCGSGAEAIATGLAAANEPVASKTVARRDRANRDPLMDELTAADDAMKAAGVDFEEWAKHSRDVWR